MKQKDRPVANGKARRSRADKSSKKPSKSTGKSKSSKSSASRKGGSKSRTKGKSEKSSKPPRSRNQPVPEDTTPPKKNLSLILSVIAVVIAALALVLTITTRGTNPDAKDVANADKKGKKVPGPFKKDSKKKSDRTPAKKSADQSKGKDPKETKKAPQNEPVSNNNDGALRMEPEGRTRSVKVIGIIDGDTLRLFGGEKVRLIGINTPEKNEPLCPEATDLLKKLLEDKDVTLAFDKEEKDRYGRTLAFVYAGGVFVNGEIIRQGLAYFYEFKPNVRYSKLFLKLQRESRAANRNIWTQKHEPASEYSSSRKSARFHRAKCKRGPKRSKVTFPSRNAALDTGRSPCPDCKP